MTMETEKRVPVTTFVTWDRAKLRRLKDRYQQAVEARENEFHFEGMDLVANYAKYLIQHLETELPQ